MKFVGKVGPFGYFESLGTLMWNEARRLENIRRYVIKRLS
jgi:hypothetical protein